LNYSEAKQLTWFFQTFSTQTTTLHLYSYVYTKMTIDEGRALILTMYKESSQKRNTQSMYRVNTMDAQRKQRPFRMHKWNHTI